MQFEIYRIGTMFCWRLLDASGNLICTGAKQRRGKSQIDEDVLSLIDGVPNAEIHDKTQVSAKEKTENERARTPVGKHKQRS